MTDPVLDKPIGYYLFREAIIVRAANDLRSLRRGARIDGASIAEIRNFFYGGWCNLLLGKLDGKTLFNKIMREDSVNGSDTDL